MIVFLGAIWVAFLVNQVVIGCDFNRLLGLEPRTWHGLIGIPAMPFLHANLRHLLSNTVPLFVLLVLLAGSRARTWESVGTIMLLGGGLLWLFGRAQINDQPAIHVGASGLIFGLVAFLILSGILERRVIPMFISALVAFLYGGSLITNILPTADAKVSWEGHLYGAIAGGLVAYGLTRGERQSAPVVNSKS